MARGVRHHFKTVDLKTPSGYLNTWMISVAPIAKIITTIRGHGHLIHRSNG